MMTHFCKNVSQSFRQPNGPPVSNPSDDADADGALSVDSESVGGANFSGASESSQAGSHTRNSSHLYSSNGGRADEDAPRFDIARSETKAVNRSKILVLAVIFVAAASFGAATYAFTRSSEEEDFQQQFALYAHEIVEASQAKSYTLYESMEMLSATFTSYARLGNNEWPYISIPDYENRAKYVRNMGNVEQIGFVPLIDTSNKQEWEDYANTNQGWINEGLRAQQNGLITMTQNISEFVFHTKCVDENHFTTRKQVGTPMVDFGPGDFAPMWQLSPAPKNPGIINYDLFQEDTFRRVYKDMWESKVVKVSEVTNLMNLGDCENLRQTDDYPHSFLLSPIYSNFEDESNIASNDLKGFMLAIFSFDWFFAHVLPYGVNGIILVLDSCGAKFTYAINGPEVIYVGEGDLHDPQYNFLEISEAFLFDVHATNLMGHCTFNIRLYPSSQLESQYTSSNPITFCVVVLCVFGFTVLVFVIYDYMVQRRQRLVMTTAQHTDQIISSLFPKNIRDRIMEDAKEQANNELHNKNRSMFGSAPRTQLKSFLNEGVDEIQQLLATKPIADLFPETTVMFGDIVGFTAWSSVREPTQVFTLLETVYHAFDEVARKRRVFKVETVGDCYVAVTGLPEPQKEHAVIMARFARDALAKMRIITKQLEVTLGPDTGDLSIRIGLHSGPVTAGVLRGQKSRFQLFGDTVNTAARIETTGERNKIHLSTETAKNLMDSGKSHWVVPREDMVVAKGKGALRTYWLELRPCSGPTTTSKSNSDASTSNEGYVDDNAWVESSPNEQQIKIDQKTQRLIDWNSDILARLLKQVVARRRAKPERQYNRVNESILFHEPNQTVLDEVKHIIHLPDFDAACNVEDPDRIGLGEEVLSQLKALVTSIAAMYRDNHFHNFDHASHVTMSVVKLLSRIVAADAETFYASNEEDDSSDDRHMMAKMHDHTYGITSDPLTQFAVVLSALIHDVDHTGVPNTQLINESPALATMYQSRSVAEQNSVDISWGLLMMDEFRALREAIYDNDHDFHRFRELVVNSVMATDIMDKELKNLRNARWERAFKIVADEPSLDTVHRKATIVIEHLIQASDVCHTMQHWHIYRKWNERLFMEMYQAYQEGRSDNDPSEFWYKGEIGFFDFYIIPLAKKLKDCGVFGVSSDEYLNYALKNRQEWEVKGEEVVANMMANIKGN